MRILTVVALSIVLALAAFGQGERATITGTVSDPAGAVVSGAPIQARNVDTGALYETTTTNTGNYTLAQLPIGTYEVNVTVPGFKRYTRGGLTVQVAQIARVDIALEVGTATESVTVSEAAPLLKTESGELSHNVSTDSMNSLPILGIGSSAAGSSSIRNPQTVLYLLPGAYVVPNAQVRVNGVPGNTASYRVEGQEANNGMQISQAQIQPSVDSIQEVTVQTSNFAAEYGQVGGGFLNYAMKSGTNQLHGTVYDYAVNEVFNANTPWVNNKPRARRHNYGFTLGGPVIIPKIYNGRDRTFFFFNWEQFRESQVVNTQFITVPIAAYRAGDFTRALTTRPTLANDPLGRPIREGGIYDPATQRAAPDGRIIRDQFAGNMIPLGRQDPVALRIQNLIPLPNQNDNLINNAIFPYPAQRVTQIPSFKIDQALGSRAKISYYWHQTKTGAQYSPLLSGSDGLPEPITSAMGTYITAYVQRANFDYTLTPTMLFHAGVGYLTDGFNDNPVVTDFNPLTEIGLKNAPINRLFPLIQGLQAAGTGGMKVMGTSQNRFLTLQKPTGNMSLTWIKGNHTYKFGGEIRLNGTMSTLYTFGGGRFQFSPAETALPYLNTTNQGGGTIGFAYASFLLGQVNQLTVSLPQNMRMGQNATGLFAQDTWKLTRKLTLDYGLRYDYQTYSRQSTASPFAQFAPTIPNPSAGGMPGAVQFDGNGPGRCNCNLANNYPYAFAPRLGFAYQMTPKTVLRGGIGMVYAAVSDAYGVTQGAYSIPAVVSNPTFSAGVMKLGDGIPFQAQAFPNLDVGQYPRPGFVTTQAPPFWLDQNAGRPARQIQWSLGVQREIFRDLVVEASYVGNRGVWWNAPHLVNPNAITEQALNQRGLSLNNPADVTLLASSVSSAVAAARGFNRIPFTGFPTGATVAQSLRPFPQFSNIIPSQAPNGNTWYDSLQMKATKRYSHGLQVTSLFTWSKQLATASPSQVYNASTVGDGGAPRNDIFNRDQNKYLSGFNQPLVFTLAGNYTVPALRINKIASLALSDWQLNALMTYASGMPIQAPASQNNLTQQLFRGTFANRVPGQPLFTQDLNCHCFDPNKEFVLNPAAWTQPGPGQWGTSAAYYDDYRFARRPVENMSLARIFRFTEKTNLNIRIEFNNVFNRAIMPNPTVANSAATQQRNAAGVPTGGFGFIAVQNTGPVIGQIPTSRQGSIVARFTF